LLTAVDKRLISGAVTSGFHHQVKLSAGFICPPFFFFKIIVQLTEVNKVGIYHSGLLWDLSNKSFESSLERLDEKML